MRCLECQTEDPDTRKFCGECGAKLQRTCPGCGAMNPTQYKFCGECGHRLTRLSEPISKELSLDEKIAKIQRYLPEGLTEKILSQRDCIEGERKLVTLMFCDMEGFMARYIAEILLKLYEAHLHNAENWIEKAVEADKRNGAIWLLGCDYELLAELSMHKEDRRGIKENLEKAIATFRRCGAEGRLKEVERKLTALPPKASDYTSQA